MIHCCFFFFFFFDSCSWVHCLSWTIQLLQVNAGLQKPNDKYGSEDNKLLYSSKLWKNIICIAFLLIQTLGKKGLVLFLMKFRTVSVRTQSFAHFILPRICFKNSAEFNAGFSEKRKLTDDSLLDQTVMSRHSSVSNCFYYVVTIALSVITHRLMCLCTFNLKHSSVHLWRM